MLQNTTLNDANYNTQCCKMQHIMLQNATIYYNSIISELIIKCICEKYQLLISSKTF
jgi:hypothetical protein